MTNVQANSSWAIVAVLVLRAPVTPCPRACIGHPPSVQLNQRVANTVAAAKAGGVIGALLIGVIEAGKHLFGK